MNGELIRKSLGEIKCPKLIDMIGELEFLSGLSSGRHQTTRLFDFLVLCFYPKGAGTKRNRYKLNELPPVDDVILKAKLEKYNGTDIWTVVDDLGRNKGISAELFMRSSVLVALNKVIPKY